MRIDLPSGEVLIDNKAYIEDFRINLAPNHQIRCKFNAICSSKKVPFDVVIYRWDFIMPFHGKIGAVDISLNGEERNTSKPIKCTVSFNILSKKWSVKGLLGTKDVDMSFTHYDELFRLINDIFLV